MKRIGFVAVIFIIGVFSSVTLASPPVIPDSASQDIYSKRKELLHQPKQIPCDGDEVNFIKIGYMNFSTFPN